MNRIQLGWIDYSSEHRNKVLAVLSLLTAPGPWMNWVSDKSVTGLRICYSRHVYYTYPGEVFLPHTLSVHGAGTAAQPCAEVFPSEA